MTPFLIATLLLASGLTCRAWGPDGHQIVSRIAEKHLSPATLRHLSELITGSIADTALASWADEVRRTRPETAPWHYVDIPVGAARLDLDHACPSPTGCVISAIEQFQKVLADKQTNTATRVEALKFLVHFVGDVHMPLHCAERNHDHGGNTVCVRWPGEDKATKLHAVWDIHFVQTNLHLAGLTALPYADQLAGTITPAQSAAWSTGTVADWAWESHQLAVAQVYPGIPENGNAFDLPASYIEANRASVTVQLTKAGLRLARLLDEALR
ncbi:MAG: hypothetical protein PCFJNLEI_01885 [Verrucomicrobiae bacterium]|nr:hypothetical protein [Verrucomicrobiae bacterium]